MTKLSNLILSFCCLLLLAACGDKAHQDATQVPSDTLVVMPTQDTLPTYYPDPHNGADYEGNYIWGAAMDLAWKELIGNVTKEEPSYKGRDSSISKMVETYNASGFTRNDVDAPSYLVRSGFGPGTLTAIRKEMKERFPNGKLKVPEIALHEDDIIIYAYFLKALEYEVPFDTGRINFEGKPVHGFNAKKGRQRHNVDILQYDSDDRFLLRLQLKQPGDQLFLAKGFAMETPDEALQAIHRHQESKGESMHDMDQFRAPILKLDYERNFLPKNGIVVKNADQTPFQITAMKEWIKFQMDEVGAKVENMATIGPIPTPTPTPLPKRKPKNLLLDKPYWVVMKRTNSARPYFILGIRNDKLMKPAQKK
jgi:hypothetical protein